MAAREPTRRAQQIETTLVFYWPPAAAWSIGVANRACREPRRQASPTARPAPPPRPTSVAALRAPRANLAALAAAADLRGTPTAQVTAQVATLVEHFDGELTRSELQEAAGLTHREHFRKAYLLPALEAGLIEMPQPDKPNSRSQRYRLTAAGKAWAQPMGHVIFRPAVRWVG